MYMKYLKNYKQLNENSSISDIKEYCEDILSELEENLDVSILVYDNSSSRYDHIYDRLKLPKTATIIDIVIELNDKIYQLINYKSSIEHLYNYLNSLGFEISSHSHFIFKYHSVKMREFDDFKSFLNDGCEYNLLNSNLIFFKK